MYICIWYILDLIILKLDQSFLSGDLCRRFSACGRTYLSSDWLLAWYPNNPLYSNWFRDVARCQIMFKTHRIILECCVIMSGHETMIRNGVMVHGIQLKHLWLWKWIGVRLGYFHRAEESTLLGILSWSRVFLEFLVIIKLENHHAAGHPDLMITESQFALSLHRHPWW